MTLKYLGFCTDKRLSSDFFHSQKKIHHVKVEGKIMFKVTPCPGDFRLTSNYFDMLAFFSRSYLTDILSVAQRSVLSDPRLFKVTPVYATVFITQLFNRHDVMFTIGIICLCFPFARKKPQLSCKIFLTSLDNGIKVEFKGIPTVSR